MNLFALQKIKQKNKHTYKLQNKSFKKTFIQNIFI